jgi:hypothetical protein
MAAVPPSAMDSAPHAAARPPVQRRARGRRPIVMPGRQELDAIMTLLARHIGPIAKIFVQKAAAEARTPDDLCERLAAHVSAPSDRAAFLRAARAKLAVNS